MPSPCLKSRTLMHAHLRAPDHRGVRATTLGFGRGLPRTARAKATASLSAELLLGQALRFRDFSPLFFDFCDFLAGSA